jgi:pimeloyl-ACP methyl ester carboxylesterase
MRMQHWRSPAHLSPPPGQQARRQLVLLHGSTCTSLSGCRHARTPRRFWALIFDEQALCEGFRVIALDRPGYGSSTPAPHRRVTDWPAKVAEAAEQLGVDKFAILAASAGAMYALACAVADATRHRIVGKVHALELGCMAMW